MKKEKIEKILRQKQNLSKPGRQKEETMNKKR